MEILHLIRNIRLTPQTNVELATLRSQKWEIYDPFQPVILLIKGQSFN